MIIENVMARVTLVPNEDNSEVRTLQSGTHATQASGGKTVFELRTMRELVISFVLTV